MNPSAPDTAFRDRVGELFRSLQDSICSHLESADGAGKFSEDRWTHASGGGGVTRVITRGGVLEKGGVNFSAVSSALAAPLASKLNVPPQGVFATGISLVLHPASPMVPAVHMNLRYIELAGGDFWFGGGADLTPFYLFDEDARHFHSHLKSACDEFDGSWYPAFKKACDEYFFLRHRNETRGIGGIFFDYRRGDRETWIRFFRRMGDAFCTAYIPIVEKRKPEAWGPKEKEWQMIRRGRYVEFNLLYDRGTLFGLETGGRTESILISLPPEVSWKYDYSPEPGSREEALCSVLKKPKAWA